MIKKIVTHSLAMIVLVNCVLAASLTYHTNPGNLLVLAMIGTIGLISLVFLAVSHAMSVSEVEELEQEVVDLKIKIDKARTPEPSPVPTNTQVRKGGLNRRPSRSTDPDL